MAATQVGWTMGHFVPEGYHKGGSTEHNTNRQSNCCLPDPEAAEHTIWTKNGIVTATLAKHVASSCAPTSHSAML